MQIWNAPARLAGMPRTLLAVTVGTRANDTLAIFIPEIEWRMPIFKTDSNYGDNGIL